MCELQFLPITVLHIQYFNGLADLQLFIYIESIEILLIPPILSKVLLNVQSAGEATGCLSGGNATKDQVERSINSAWDVTCYWLV